MKYFDYLATLEPSDGKYNGQFFENPPSRNIYSTQFKLKHPDYLDIFGATLPSDHFDLDIAESRAKSLDNLAQLHPSFGKDYDHLEDN